MKSTPIIVEERDPVPVDRVWKAITDKEEMKKWYFELDEFRPEVGFEFSFAGQGHKGENYIHLCRITEVIPNNKLQYSWRYENYPGNSLVTFELFDEGKSTRLRLTHEGLETFSTDNPDFAVTSFQAGWSEIIGSILKDHLSRA